MTAAISRKRERWPIWLPLAFCIATIAGCAGPAAEVIVQRPPNFPQAAQLRKIAVLDFGGSAGNQASERLEAELSSATTGGQPYFTMVSGRGRLPAAIAEGVGIGELQRLGRQLGVDAVYTGTANFSVQHQGYSESRSQCVAGDGSKKLVQRCTAMANYSVACQRTIAAVTVTPRAVSVNNAAIIYNKSVSKTQTDASCSDEGPPSPDGALLGGALQAALTEIREDVTPHEQTVRIPLMTEPDGLAGDAATRFSGAIAFAKVRNYERACGLWKSFPDAQADNLAVQYDLSICDEVLDGDVPGALSRLRRTEDRLTAPNRMVTERINYLSGLVVQARTMRQLKTNVARSAPAR
ncbi:hypothetical protein [Rhodovastum atsumiense]|uniref:Uncharacterized protein n=1 Tax=Rhodovastum atsumiense TaxID=504468 RepID=A0A5M6IWJ4_9PROT|nr:hypothetical protein [Rhodovastum atsumiense]KAA5612690.1 hypothetical protein F1189_08095 [Rhodovastum atsumiense]